MILTDRIPRWGESHDVRHLGGLSAAGRRIRRGAFVGADALHRLERIRARMVEA